MAREFWIDLSWKSHPTMNDGTKNTKVVSHGCIDKDPKEVGIDDEGYIHVLEATPLTKSAQKLYDMLETIRHCPLGFCDKCKETTDLILSKAKGVASEKV